MTRLRCAAVLLAALLAACTRTGTSGAPAASHPDRLVIATNADPRNLNPALASATPVLELSAFLYSWAVIYDEHAKPVPDALRELPTVENGDVSRDGLTLRYKLRTNITWSDGQPLTCRDLRFTWRVMINPKNNVNTTDGWKDIRDVDCGDPYVAVVHMKRVYAPFLQQLWSVNGNGPILPEHVLGSFNDDKGSLNRAPYNSAPTVGSGPYTFVSWVRGSEIRMRANPRFYLGKPKIGEVVYKIIPDGNTLATQAVTHEVDFAFGNAPASYARLQEAAGLRVITPVVYVFDHLDFNLRRPLFQDVRVRRALTYAIDRGDLLRKIRHGLGELSDTFLDKTLYPDAYDPNVTTYPYDPAKAKALLDDAGWKPGPGGIRVKNGQRLAFQVSTQTESTTGQAIQQQVQAAWRAVGADVQVKNYPTPLFFDNTANGIVQGGKYDVALFAWVGAPDIDQSPLYSAHNFAPHGQNSLFWDNSRATRAMDDANATIDQKRRLADYRIVQEEFAKDDPSIILWFRKDIDAYTTALQDFTPTAVITVPFWNTWQYRF